MNDRKLESIHKSIKASRNVANYNDRRDPLKKKLDFDRMIAVVVSFLISCVCFFLTFHINFTDSYHIISHSQWSLFLYVVYMSTIWNLCKCIVSNSLQILFCIRFGSEDCVLYCRPTWHIRFIRVRWTWAIASNHSFSRHIVCLRIVVIHFFDFNFTVCLWKQNNTKMSIYDNKFMEYYNYIFTDLAGN